MKFFCLNQLGVGIENSNVPIEGWQSIPNCILQWGLKFLWEKTGILHSDV